MSYEELDTGAETAESAYLYEFWHDGTRWGYVDAAEDVEHIDYYASLPITHDELGASQDVSKASLSVTLPTSSEVAQLFKGWMPESPVTLTLRRWLKGPTGHTSGSVVVWKGRVTQAHWGVAEVTLDLESIFTALQRNGCRARVQAMCRHPLYETGCEVSKSTYAQSASITAVAGLVLTVPAAAGETDGWWSGGHLLLPDGTLRSIVEHTGVSLTLGRPSRYLAETAPPIAVTLYPGCDHSPVTCVEKFDNLANYGGFPMLPGINPFNGISLV